MTLISFKIGQLAVQERFPKLHKFVEFCYLENIPKNVDKSRCRAGIRVSDASLRIARLDGWRNQFNYRVNGRAARRVFGVGLMLRVRAGIGRRLGRIPQGR